MSNHLANQSSPYLLQHASNPVDWYPWGEEAFEKARKEDKPVFLSIGYSTCHWCHVMARESFESEETARILNRYFVSVKVDREERPDIDSVYMSVCQALSGSGGWPMSIFMTAGQKPFFAGTYFPPVSRHGMTGFRELLLAIAEKWENDRGRLLQAAESIVAQISAGQNNRKEFQHTGETGERIDESLPERAVEIFSGSFDARYGGFGQAPKFPVPHNLLFLMLYAYLREEDAKELKGNELFGQVKVTLERMRRGGIFDQIGYGFSRYSTDRFYLVPHFEKMLYDNALLIMAYAVAYRLSKEAAFRQTAEETAAYILREMTGEKGEFYSAQDADSDGEEGKFYVWSVKEVCEVLGKERGRQLCEYFNITEKGNFEGKNIPNLLSGNEISDRFEEERKLLYYHRELRTRPHLDDKILTAWNALMICAMCFLYRVTGKRDYLSAAERAERFLAGQLMEGNLLYVGCREGVRFGKGFLDEYAYTAAAYLSLYDATADQGYLNRAQALCKEAEIQFADEKGGYFLYGKRNGELIMRPKETYDGALPSGNAVMAYVLVRLSQLGKSEDIAADELAAEKQLAFLSAEAASYPAGHSMFLIALLYDRYPPQRITVVLDGKDSVQQIMAQMPLYASVTVLERESAEYPLLHGSTTYYVCKGHTCLPPTNRLPCHMRPEQ